MSFFGTGGGSGDPNNEGDNQDNASDSPFKWVVVPIAILIMASIIITLLRVRKRNQQRRSQGLNALQRDVEAMGPNRVRRAGDSRWQWADGTRTGRRFGLGAGNGDEGLNELGEAPPAYSPPTKSSDDVELHEITTSRAMPQSNPTLVSGTIHTAGPNDVTPPAYGEARAGDSTTSPSEFASPQYPTTPAPAVLPSR